MTVAQVDGPLGRGMLAKKRYTSPGVDATTRLLRRLEDAGMAESQGDDAWVLADTGRVQYEGQARMFQLSSADRPPPARCRASGVRSGRT